MYVCVYVYAHMHICGRLQKFKSEEESLPSLLINLKRLEYQKAHMSDIALNVHLPPFTIT